MTAPRASSATTQVGLDAFYNIRDFGTPGDNSHSPGGPVIDSYVVYSPAGSHTNFFSADVLSRNSSGQAGIFRPTNISSFHPVTPLSAVPLPASWPVFVLALLGMGYMARRRVALA